VQGGGVLLRGHDQARPGQRLDAAARREVGQVGGQFARQAREVLRQRAIQAQARRRRARAAQAQGEVDLAARDALREALAQARLQRAQVVRQAHRDLEVAVVHRAQFPRQQAPFGRRLARGEGGHAADHGRGPEGSGRAW
jgi:hypothetical protein